MYGGDYVALRDFAIQVLSQSCTASSAEQNWAQRDDIHSKKRNRLGREKVDKLLFIGNNLELFHDSELADGIGIPKKRKILAEKDESDSEGSEENESEEAEREESDDESSE